MAYSASFTPFVANTTKVALVDLATATKANPNFLASVIAGNEKLAIAKGKLAADAQSMKFVVFGIGTRSDLVGKTIQDAPSSTPQNKEFTPDTLYSRFGAIFLVNGEEVLNTERARFIGVVAIEDDELETTEKDVIGYYKVAR